jgi:hypothetical protein
VILFVLSQEKLAHVFLPKVRRTISYVFLAFLLALLLEFVREFRTPGYYAYQRWSSLIVPTFLILNHLAFAIVKPGPWKTALQIITFCFMIIALYLAFFI